MAEVFPFAAYRYDPARVKLEDVLTQPYDKITAAMQARYYALHPDNLIAVEKGRALPGDSPRENVYTRAARALDDWIARRVLLRETAPALYVYTQEFAAPGTGERRTRRGFIALGRVHDYADGVVHRHEQTLAGPRADRLELLRHTRAHTGQLFMLFSDPQREVDALLDAAAPSGMGTGLRDEFSVTHTIWPVTDPAVIGQFQRVMSGKKLVIADGHHRYETALAYRNERRAATGRADPDAPHEKVMMTFVGIDQGLLILPTHRVVAQVPGFDFAALRRQLEAWFEVRPLALEDGAQVRAVLAEEGKRGRAVGVFAEGRPHLLLLRAGADLAALLPEVSAAQRTLDVVLLHRLILERALGITAAAVSGEKNITYEREMESAVRAVREGRAQLAFLLNPVSVEQTVQMAFSGEVLPQKSTDFYPKLLSGLTIYRVE
jgi:uncharacterized protein (DUF1015 family)